MHISYLLLGTILLNYVCIFGANSPVINTSENAAYWYNKAFTQMTSDANDIATKTSSIELDNSKYVRNKESISSYFNCNNGNIQLTEDLKIFLKNNKYITNMYLRASTCNYCNWEFGSLEDFSKKRRLFFDGTHILIASSLVNAQKGEYIQAAKEASAALKIIQYYDVFYPSFMYDYGTEDRITVMGIKQLLPLIAKNKQAITKVRSSLKYYIKNQHIWGELFDKLTENNIKKVKRDGSQFIQTASEFGGNSKIDFARYIESRNDIKNLWVLPYKDGYPAIMKLEKKTWNKIEEVQKKIDNKIGFDINLYIFSLFDFTASEYNYLTFCRTCENATYIASVIYSDYLQTGQLPDKMLEGMPKDPYSGKDFLLIKTDNGFKIKCTGKDLKNNKIHEFNFTI